MLNKAKRLYHTAKTYKQKLRKRLTYRTDTERKIAELEERLQWFMDHAEITALKPATGYLRNKQLSLIGFALEFFEEIKGLQIKPFLIGGNLIGAYRHKGFIPWDDDLDFGLIRDDYEKLIDYCKKHFIVELYKGKWSEYSNDKHLARMDNIVKKNPGKYVLDVWVDQIQIMKGTSCIDRLAIDFWAYDYYADLYSLEKHRNYLKFLSEKKLNIDYVNDIVSFLKTERESNVNICDRQTTKLFPGIDNLGGFKRITSFKDWLYTEDVFPLQKVLFEGHEFYAPHNLEKWMAYEYPDYMGYPPDAGNIPHEGYKEKFILDNMPTVEFYLIDAFEIYHFMPFYRMFEKNGIYSYFIACPPDANISGNWFDYHKAIQILEHSGVRYKKQPNYNADFVFTTQDEYLVHKYKGKKIHLCYGVALTAYSFCESERSICGFDLKLVHGEQSYLDILKKGLHIQMIKIGYPRYSSEGSQPYFPNSVPEFPKIKDKNKCQKPILFYFPTWDNAASILTFAPEIKELSKYYFIITKMHHCTSRLESKSERRKTLYEISDIVLEGTSPFENILCLGNIALCDAISGAATEIPFLKREIKLILLFSSIREKNDYKQFVDEYAICVKSPGTLVQTVNSVYADDPKQKFRSKMINQLYEENIEPGFKELKKYIMENTTKGAQS